MGLSVGVVNHTDMLNKIRKLAIVSLFSDDDLMDLFVLKGGNAINIAYGINDRSSMDLDFSMRQDFGEDYDLIKQKICNAIEQTFSDEGFKAFDIKLYPTPKVVREEYKDFWGGYTLEFKVIDEEHFNQLGGNVDDNVRRNAIVIGSNQEKKVTIDISKYEYVDTKQEVDIDGYTVYVYTPLMVIYEKLRALCQQVEYYSTHIVPTNRKRRARDFFDIYSILEKLPKIDIYNLDNLKIMIEIFKVKKVPLFLLEKLREDREFHRESFHGVKDHVSAGYQLQSFDFYFEKVIAIAENIVHILKEANLYEQEEVKSGH